MTRFILPLALLLTTTALACPVKAGYFANGQFKDTTGLTPQCSAIFKNIAAGVKPGEYGEVYKTTLTAAGGFKVGKAFNLFRANGWKSAGVVRKGNDKTYVFNKGKKQTVMLVRENDDSVLIVVIGDK
ncbi:hypothetical protein [Deinococcus altitudinis]|uniref:hypothetical protein n=1 Tax=Deinococcus altitudinis TaxID=468914 RepID=UPI0038916689